MKFNKKLKKNHNIMNKLSIFFNKFFNLSLNEIRIIWEKI